MSTAQEIVDAITEHVGNDKYSNWYAGIAADPEDRLFGYHEVDRKNGKWIYDSATSNASARSAEDALHRAGFKGGPGGGDSKTKGVYAYKITSATVE